MGGDINDYVSVNDINDDDDDDDDDDINDDDDDDDDINDDDDDDDDSNPQNAVAPSIEKIGQKLDFILAKKICVLLC